MLERERVLKKNVGETWRVSGDIYIYIYIEKDPLIGEVERKKK